MNGKSFIFCKIACQNVANFGENTVYLLSHPIIKIKLEYCNDIPICLRWQNLLIYLLEC
jgi:hypothetical protein